jgi:hypothetical protein
MRPIVAALLALLASAPGAGAMELPKLAADASRTGHITLASAGPAGSRAEFFERVGDRAVALGAATVGSNGFALLPDAATWRCDRVLRHFRMRGEAPDGAVYRGRYSLRTPSCRNRLAIEAPPRVKAGAPVPLTVTDSWGLGGVRARLCAAGAGARGTCEPLAFARGTAVAERAMRPARRGVWRFVVRLAGHRRAVRVGVGVAAPPRTERPMVLATGDSTIQGIDGELADRLPRRAQVRRDFYPATGISRPASPESPYWPDVARRQAFAGLPRLTVISIGAADGFDMAVPGGEGVACCGDAWIAEYARRVREMTAAYSRGGEARVLWLTLPRPRDGDAARVAAAVNAAVRSAASGDAQVRVVELDRTFTPGWRFRARMRVDGRRVRVRERDGVHLTARGTALAARIVAAAVRRWPATL